jgi:hypothetical protein
MVTAPRQFQPSSSLLCFHSFLSIRSSLCLYLYLLASAAFFGCPSCRASTPCCHPLAEGFSFFTVCWLFFCYFYTFVPFVLPPVLTIHSVFSSLVSHGVCNHHAVWYVHSLPLWSAGMDSVYDVFSSAPAGYRLLVLASAFAFNQGTRALLGNLLGDPRQEAKVCMLSLFTFRYWS